MLTYLEKFKFTCKKCDESFVIWHNHLESKERIVCPNCGNAFPDGLVETLKTSYKAVNTTYKLLKDNDLLTSVEFIFKAP